MSVRARAWYLRAVLVLCVRHGEAVPPHHVKDPVRWLTARGRASLRAVGAGLVERVPALDLVASSPLVRAVQTAEHLAASFGAQCPVIADEAMATGSVRDVVRLLEAHATLRALALVGHEPSIRAIAAFLSEREAAPFEPATVVAAEWDPTARRGRYLWRVDPSELGPHPH